MASDDLSSDVLDGFVVASGSQKAVCDARLLNSLRAYLQQFERSVDVAPFVPDGAVEHVGPLLLVCCEGRAARCVTLWAVACDYLRAHDDEFDVEVLDTTCRRLRDVLGVRPGDEGVGLPS